MSSTASGAGAEAEGVATPIATSPPSAAGADSSSPIIISTKVDDLPKAAPVRLGVAPRVVGSTRSRRPSASPPAPLESAPPPPAVATPPLPTASSAVTILQSPSAIAISLVHPGGVDGQPNDADAIELQIKQFDLEARLARAKQAKSDAEAQAAEAEAKASDARAKASDARANAALAAAREAEAEACRVGAVKSYLFACRSALMSALEKGVLPPLHPQGVSKSGIERIILKFDSGK